MYYSRKKPSYADGMKFFFFSIITVGLIVSIILYWNQENVETMEDEAGNWKHVKKRILEINVLCGEFAPSNYFTTG